MVTDTVTKVINNKKQLLHLFSIIKPSFVCMLMSGVAILYSMQLTAGDWKISPRVSVKGTYTDNADLSSSDKNSAFYTQVTPGVAVKREGGGRVQLDADYALDYTENRPGNRGRTIAHSLRSNMQAELYKDVVFLDASAGAHLSSLTSGGQRGGDSVGDVSDPIQTYTYSLSPYFKHHFGRYINTLTRYTFDQVVNSGSGGSDSYNNQLLLAIGSGPYFMRFPWKIGYRHSKTGNEDGAEDSETTSLNGNISYIVSRKYRVNLAVGKVDYDIQSSRSSTDSVTWNAGATWTPNPRTNMDFSYGRQFFGNHFGFDFSHRLKRSIWTMGYSKSVTDARTQQIAHGTAEFQTKKNLGQSFDFLNKTFTLTEVNDGVGTYTTEFDYADLIDEQYVIETLTTGFSLETRRSSFSVDAHFTQRNYEVRRIKGRDIGIDVDWDRRLTPKINTKVGLSWQKNRAAENDREDKRWTLSLGLSRRLTPHTHANLDYKYRRLDSSGSSASEYRENQVSLTLASHW